MGTWFRKLGRLVVAFVGMLGLRLDQAGWNLTFLLWALLYALSLLAYGEIFVWDELPDRMLRPYVIGYAFAAWTLYYVGLSTVLGGGMRRWMVAHWGEVKARRIFNAALGIIFLHQGFAHGAVMEVWPATIRGVDTRTLMIVGGALMVFGAGCKLWATYLTSLDTYYYNDMFLGRASTPTGDLVAHGPYRWFKNPMYGVGNLQGYGSALIAASWQGLLITGIFHASIYGFYHLFERPFIKRVYAPRA